MGTNAELLRGFAEIFASLDENPRELTVPVTVDEEMVMEEIPDFRGRWIAEHPVPLTLRKGRNVFRFIPTTGNRVKVRV